VAPNLVDAGYRPIAHSLTRDRHTRLPPTAGFLVFIHEADGSWAIHGLGAPGVRLSKVEMVALTESILGRAR
jgi:hypothetical protein